MQRQLKSTTLLGKLFHVDDDVNDDNDTDAAVAAAVAMTTMTLWCRAAARHKAR